VALAVVRTQVRFASTMTDLISQIIPRTLKSIMWP
jgi:hypothetical protein